MEIGVHLARQCHQMQSRVEQNCNCYCLAKLLSSENGYGCTLFIQTGNLEGISESVFEGLVEQSTADLCFFVSSAEQSLVELCFLRLSRAKHGIYCALRCGENV